MGENVDISKSGVASLLARRCLSCHNDVDRKGDFSVESKQSLMDSEMLVPHDAEASYLLDVLLPQGGHAPQMPKDSDPLTFEEVTLIRKWIQQGAIWPDRFKITPPVVLDFDWWSLQPLTQPEVPTVSTQNHEDAWKKNPIDAFIARRHIEKGLTPAHPASKRQLIRRVTYDLIGLPPTPEEIDRFLSDESSSAYSDLVNRLLDSPAYGEHWARHWLDVVKYADTCGYDKDKLRENAWPYRDYVIRSLNEDKSYAQFVQEQIAGDALFPGNPDGILGLGFLACGPWDFIGHVEVPESKLDGMVARNLDRDDVVSNTLNTFCSVTIQCARCHHHKFDPFTQQHYYSLQAVFAAIDRAERPYDLDPQVEQQRRDLETRLEQLLAEQKQLDKEIEVAGGPKLKELNEKVSQLAKQVNPKDKRPEFGYHSQIATSPDQTKWVQIDLGKPHQLSEIILHACHDDYAGIGSGFGFPVRYQISAAIQESELEKPESVVIDAGKADVPNPGLQPVLHTVNRQARYLRITATRLVERKNDFIFALAEVEATDDQGVNIAHNAAVSALDTIEAPVRWGKKNLTDGIWAQAEDPSAAQMLADARKQRDEILKRIDTPQRQQKLRDLADSITSTKKEIAALPIGKMVYAAATHFKPQGNFKPTSGTPRSIHLLHRGNINQPLDEMSPGRIPISAMDNWQFSLPSDHDERARRAALAKWLTSPDHPLTWRSIVNRVWQYHFGEGLVASPNDFGRMGQLPSHPELLDWLAVEFRDGGQSLKSLHRLIVTSATYRQSSANHDENAQIDGSNRFLWRMNRQRLSAEEIRDSILFVSGQLDRTPGGPGDRLFVLEHPEHSPHYEYHLFDPESAKRHRRSIYRFIVRSQPDPWMSVMDCADSSQSTPKRSETLTPLQALSLMNNKFNLLMAKRFAEDLQENHESTTDQIRDGFQRVTGRQPSEDEVKLLSEHAQQHGMNNTCRLLFNFSEFMFVD